VRSFNKITQIVAVAANEGVANEEIATPQNIYNCLPRQNGSISRHHLFIVLTKTQNWIQLNVGPEGPVQESIGFCDTPHEHDCCCGTAMQVWLQQTWDGGAST
jgi:hypothetical protein